MIRLLSKKKYSPIGVDLGSRCVKLVQLDADCEQLVEAARGDLPAGVYELDAAARVQAFADAIGRAREGRAFRGRDAVVCLSAPQLFIQNIRVPKGSREELHRLVLQEAAGRIPFAVNQAEIRFVEAADVRQGDALRREVIVLATEQAVIDERIQICLKAGLRPVAIDVEPAALLRCYVRQFRRDEDRQQRSMFVNIGGSRTSVVISEGSNVLFIKYIDVGGVPMDAAVAQKLNMGLEDAAALRRHNGDRRADQQDPEITRTVGESIRPVIDQLASELSMCIRYHSVTFRGQPLVRLVVGGGEASKALVDALSTRLDLKCELGEPLRSYAANLPGGRAGQWDIAVGLALKKTAVTA